MIGYIDRESSSATFGNILFGGLVGMIIDHSTGGTYDLRPGALHVVLKPMETGQAHKVRGNGGAIGHDRVRPSP